MKMTPIKKIVIALAAITVALSLITANNMASVMLIVASRQADSANQQSVQADNTVVQNPQTNTNNSQGSSSTGNNTVADNTATGNTATTDAATNNNAASNNSGASNNTSTDKPAADDKGSADKTTSGKLSDKELVDLYKKAVTNAKSKAKTVVRVKDGALNYKGIVEAGALSSVGSSLMGAFMVADEASIEVKNEAWTKEELPPSNAACNLTTAGVQKISYTEEGNNYIVTVVAKDATNPKGGSDGIGSIASVIEEEQITGAIGSFPLLKLSNISLAYENVTAVATIDKATGNLVALKTNAPCVLGLDAAMGPLSINGAKVGIQVISEFTIAY